MLTAAGAVSAEMNTVVHNHSVKLAPPSRGAARWACDMNRPEMGGRCLSGITTFGQAVGVQRWRCEPCDFDICLDCVLECMHVDHARLDEVFRQGPFCIFVQSNNKPMLTMQSSLEEAEWMFDCV